MVLNLHRHPNNRLKERVFSNLCYDKGKHFFLEVRKNIGSDIGA